MKISPPNYTQTPNDLFDHWLPLLKEVELKVLLVIMRKTFGWHKVRDRISISQLQKLTGSTATNVLKAVNGLIKKGIVEKKVEGENGTQITYYELVVQEDSNNLYPCQISSPPPCQISSPTPANLAVTKETIQNKSTDLIDKGKILISDFNGKKITVCKDDLYFIAEKEKLDWTAQEITLLMKRLELHTGNVRELTKFCKAIINKERAVSQCQNKTISQKSKKPLETTKKSSSGETMIKAGTLEHPFRNSRQTLGY